MVKTPNRLTAIIRYAAQMAGYFAAALIACACARQRPDSDPPLASRAKSAEMPVSAQGRVDPESAPHSEVILGWRNMRELRGTALNSAQHLSVDVRNATTKTVTGRLVLVAAGLDGRRVERPLEDFTLTGRESREVKIDVGRLPIQSEISMGQVTVRAEIDRAKGSGRGFTAPLYYRFQGGYKEAVFFSVHDIGKQPNGGLLTDDLMNVQGRILELNGTWTDAALASARDVETAMASGHGKQGLSGFGRNVVDQTAGPRKRGPVQSTQKGGSSLSTAVAPVASETTIVLCTTWGIWYADSGQGEDHLDPGGLGWTGAARAYAYVTDPWWQTTTFWEGYLDGYGCATISVPPGNYWIWKYTTSVAGGGVEFQTFWMDGATPLESYDYSAFTVYSNSSWVQTWPNWNDDAIQAAAVTGQIINQQLWTTNGLGIQGGTYHIHANQGCGGGMTDDSCYNNQVPPFEVELGTAAVGGGATHAYWKFLVAHEIGHSIQHRAMGFHAYGYGDGNTTHQRCLCEHYDSSWGNSIHCLQSRQSTGGGEIEGFAHSFATRVFNTPTEENGTFVYYKPFLNQGPEPEYPPVVVNAYDPYRWMEDWCPASNMGIEVDWLNFYYNVSSQAYSYYTDPTTLFEIYQQACGSVGTPCTQSDVIHWSNLDAGAQAYFGSATDPYYIHFNEIGLWTGVAH